MNCLENIRAPSPCKLFTEVYKDVPQIPVHDFPGKSRRQPGKASNIINNDLW